VAVRLRRFLPVAMALLAGVPASAAAADRLTWKSCHTDFGPSFQCAVAQVPLDYDAPNGAKIDLALTRLPATDHAHRIGSLFLNPGGPGGSGVDFLLGLGSFLYSDEVRARFDLVGFDPRGVIRSTPLRCFDSDVNWPALPPAAFPLNRQQAAAQAAYDRTIDAACRQRGGAIRDHMSTADVARDLDRLRELVGDRQLTYAGYSYGSYLGVTYANLFPDKVRALLVDGVVDPIAWSTGRGREGTVIPFSTRLRSDTGAQKTLNEFFRLCNAGGPRCAFSGHAGTRYGQLAKRLLRHPVEFPLGDGTSITVDYTFLVSFTGTLLYQSSIWPDLAAVLADVDALSRGQAEPAEVPARASAALKAAAFPPRYLAPQAAAGPTSIEEDYANILEGSTGVACSDSTNPTTYEAWYDSGIIADRKSGYFGRPWTWAWSTCAEWPGADADRYTGPWNAKTANPMLVVGNLFDPATRYQGAQIVHNLLPNSALLTVHGWGHTSLFLSTCADQAIARYLIAQVTPRPGTVCRQDVVPFTPGSG